MSHDPADRSRVQAPGTSPLPPSRRRAWRPLVGAAVIALIALTAALTVRQSSSDDRPAARPGGGLGTTYRVEPPGAAAAQQTASVIRARLHAAGVRNATVTVTSSAKLIITTPATHADLRALVQRGRAAIYDWEASLLGPRNTPAPADPSVAGGSAAGRAGAITKAQAETRAARHPSGRVVRAPSGEPDQWFVLAGTPALTDAEIDSAIAATDPPTREPVIAIEFTPRGQTAFKSLTRELAHRARNNASNGATDNEAGQHFVLVIDDRIVATPQIDFRDSPDGIDGRTGAQIQGGLTSKAARQIAAVLTTGPLPAALSTPTGPPPAKRHN